MVTRLHIEQDLSQGALLSIEGDQAHYLSRVMRVSEGDQLALFNGRDGEWLAEIVTAQKKSVQIKVNEQMRSYLAPPDIWLCFAPIKFGRIDYLVQKATELGAAKLMPVITDYTQSDRVNVKRLRANAVEAAEQCERVEVPEIAEPVSLKQLLGGWDSSRILLLADESGQGQAIAEWAANADADQPYALLIGPEGGFSEAERALLYQQPFVKGVGLGPRILRADTAAIAMLSVLQSHIGDWQLAPRFKQPI